MFKPSFRLISILLGVIIFTSCVKERSDLPNIVIIFADDQGYADLGCYGAEGFETPNIDRLADEGMRFTGFYVSEAVCSASRASLLTGCYAQRVSIRGALNAIAYTGLHPEETTIASILRSKGYKTGIVGKWHLGHRLEFLPANFGFDEYYGLPYSNDMWPVGYDGLPNTSGTKGLYPTLCLLKDSICVKEINTLEDQAELTTLYTQKAVDFIYRNKNNPFFLYLPHSMVHVPLGVSDKYAGQSEQGMFGDVMMEMDWSVGQVLSALEDNGLDENTIVIYTSDNGPWLNFGNHAGSARPFREGKGTAWEGGVRVPFIIKWPEKIEGGRVTDAFATTMDILPTLAGITGAELPEKKIDGLDVSSILFGDSASSPRESFYYFYEGGLRAVRKGKYKLMLPHQSRSYEGVEPGNDGFPGATIQKEVSMALYDLEADPGEQSDCAADHAGVVEDLLLLAAQARLELGDDITDAMGTEVRECGRIGGVDSVYTMARGKTISLATNPASRYRAGGPSSLIDGILASYDFLDGKWHGFRGEDLHALIDLGEIMPITEVSLRFLKNQTSWIFFPGEVSISLSDDNLLFETVHTEKIENSEKDMGIEIRNFNSPVNKEARYIRIEAKGIGNCPDWHPGRNGDGWLFTDEIIIR